MPDFVLQAYQFMLSLLDRLTANHYAHYIFAGALACYLLRLVYELVKIKWPTFYFSLSDQTSIYVSVSPFRFISFRLLPIMIILTPILAVVAEDKPQRDVIYLGLLTALVHAISTNGLSLKKLFFGEDGVKTYFNKPNQIIYHFFIILICLLGGLMAAILGVSSFGQAIAPDFSNVVDNTWSAALAALIAVYGYRQYRANHVDESDIFEKLSNKISIRIKQYIDEFSIANRADKKLVLAVCLVESLQRPAWLRKVEWLKSFIVKQGTYGVMQVNSPKYISDKESIRMAVEEYFMDSMLLTWPERMELIQRYNSDENFIQLVQSAYSYIEDSV